MRIIAGKHRGRALLSPPGDEIRPTAAKARGAMFNILSHGALRSGWESVRAADIFCGTGALGFEALSRGASHVTFVDNASEPLALVRKTAEKFGEVARTEILRANAAQLPRSATAYDLVFLDPPYRSHLLPKAMKSLMEQGWLAEGAIIVAEYSRYEPFSAPEGLEVFDERHYGAASVAMLRPSPSLASGRGNTSNP